MGVFHKPAQGICGKVWPSGNFAGAPAHYYNMDCDTIRVAISTQIDGEVPWLPAGELETHLAGCPGCRDWQRRAHTVTRRVRLGGAFLDHDLAPGVLAAVPAARDRGWLRQARRGLLIALALAQFAIAAPMLFLGHDREAGLHAAHELGSFNLALAIAFAVGAIRPRLSAGLAWPCAIAAGGLVATAVIDLLGGQAIGPDEAEHLVALAGAALLAWQSVRPGTESAAPAIVPAEGPAATPGGDAEVSAVERLDSAHEHPWGGDAARATGPAVAAHAVSSPFPGTKATTDRPPVADPPGYRSAGRPHDDRGTGEQRGARRDAHPDARDEAVA